MSSDIPTMENDPQPSMAVTILCAAVALALGLLGVLVVVFMLLADMNLTFTRNLHTALFVTGWSLAAACFHSLHRLLRHPSCTSLLTLIPIVILVLLMRWLLSSPGFRGLMH